MFFRIGLAVGPRLAGKFRILGRIKIRSVEIVLAGDPDQREQGVATGIGQRRAHALRRGHIANAADRPFRGHPLSRRMSQHRTISGSVQNFDLV
jgi:hypothetical protein